MDKCGRIYNALQPQSQKEVSPKLDQFTKLILSIMLFIGSLLVNMDLRHTHKKKYCCNIEICVRKEHNFLNKKKQKSLLSCVLQIQSDTKKVPFLKQLTFLQSSVQKNASDYIWLKTVIPQIISRTIKHELISFHFVLSYFFLRVKELYQSVVG